MSQDAYIHTAKNKIPVMLCLIVIGHIATQSSHQHSNIIWYTSRGQPGGGGSRYPVSMRLTT